MAGDSGQARRDQRGAAALPRTLGVGNRQRHRGGRHLAPRLHALERAVESSRGMIPREVVDRVSGVRANAGERLARGDAAVVVALAGGTGSGKSSLFNAIAGSDVAEVGVKRPTTTDPVALVVGEIEGSDTLLDWLEVRKRFTPEKPVGISSG